MENPEHRTKLKYLEESKLSFKNALHHFALFVGFFVDLDGTFIRNKTSNFENHWKAVIREGEIVDNNFKR